MMPVQLSIIIPTHRRPHLLARAIASALRAAPGGDVEVVVVPNGNDDSWQAVAATFADERRVRWHYLVLGNASAARNHGLAQSQGRYVRFLDDDDVLLPAALAQFEALIASDADLSSAPLALANEQGREEAAVPLPDVGDYLEAALLCVGIGLAAGSIYRRDVLAGSQWRTDVSLYDDYLWSLDVAAHGDWRWIQFKQPVAAYVQHTGERLSRLRRTTVNSQHVVEAITALHTHCVATGRLNPARQNAFATALLTHAHSAFPASPVFLSRVIRQAQSLDRRALPRHSLFMRHHWLGRQLLLLEWALLPLRLVSRGLRRLSWRPKG